MGYLKEYENIKKKADGSRVFWICYASFVVLIAIAIIIAVVHVKNVMVEYEEKQPEKTVERVLDNFKEAAAEGELSWMITYPEIAMNYLDSDFKEISEYEERFKGAKEFTYSILSGGYSDSGQSYSILADGEPVAVLFIESAGEEKKLAILNVTDWRVKSIEPVLSYTTYEYSAQIPDGFTLYLNGRPVEEGRGVSVAGMADGSGSVYTITDIHNEPDFTIKNPYGEEVRYNMANNNITVATYTYDLELPAGFTVYAGDTQIEGKENADGKIELSFVSNYSRLTIRDAYGHTVSYNHGDSLKTASYALMIPTNFSFRLEDNPELDTERYAYGGDIAYEYRYIEDYHDMPWTMTYFFPDSLEVPKITVTDNIGNKCTAMFENGVCEMIRQASVDELPASISEEIDPISYAKQWTLFTTDDLDDNYGFNTIKKILIPDSYLYNQAYKFAHSADITLILRHWLDDPPFSAESVSNFVVYDDDCFSCDIYLSKEMTIYEEHKHVTAVTNATFYFIKYDGSWRIADMQDKVNQ